MPKAAKPSRATARQKLVALMIERRQRERARASASSSHQVQEAPPASSLERLPGELLNKIYKEIGFSEGRLSLSLLQQPALTIACPSLAPTYHAMFFDQMKFEVNVYTTQKLHKKLSAPERVAQHGGIYGAGKLAIPPSGWLRRYFQDNADSIRFRDVYLNICEMDGYALATVLIKSRRRQGPKSNILTARTLNQDARLRAMIENARVQAHVEHSEAEFAGISLAQLEMIAECFLQ